ncbi:MAG TPA: membrane protein insertion efficiency factor YidD [Flavobacteriaceae bacterium]|nr:membrane protein insertion efficiency factor YidD [Flavobacteriaceae bacterium]
MARSPKQKDVNFSLTSIFIFPIKIYQKFISPLFPGSCRFHPTCSQYSIDALREHGIFKGTFLAVRRIARCHPWGGSGYDPVPNKTKSAK